MIKNLVQDNGVNNSAQSADDIIKSYINVACEQILECTAVFKNTDIGANAFDEFMSSLGCEIK